MMTSSRAAKFALLGLTFCVVYPVAAQQQMDEMTLRQRMIAAQGKPPDQYREEIITASSADGTYLRREYHSGIDYRVVYGTGPFAHQSGRYEGREWDQDANGVTTIHDSTPSRERHDPRQVSVSRVNQPVASWRLADQDVHGIGTVQYFDPSTFHLIRSETITPAGTITTVYDDFLTVDGYTAAHHWVTDDGTTGAHVDSSVVTLVPSAVSEADLAIPSNRKLVDFPAGDAPVVLPAIFNPPRIIVHATIDDHVLNFLLDTSSAGITLDANVAHQLGLINSTQTLLANTRPNGLHATIPEIRVGDLAMRNVVASLGRVNANWQVDKQTAGALGYDFLRSATLTIDYSRRSVVAVPSTAFSAPTMTPDSDILAMRVIDHHPVLSVTVNGAMADRMVLDTSADTDMVLFGDFARRNSEILAPKIATPEDPVLYNGTLLPDGKGYRMQEVDIGRYNFKPFDVIAVDRLKNFSPDTDGVLGPGILEHFTASLDMLGGKLYLVHSPGQ